MSLFILVLIIMAIYYQFFLFGKIPFPGDLLVASYSPWFDYYKIPVQNPLISDVFSQFFLWKYLAIDSLKNFQWPLWNPYSFTGTPLLATYHSATLYPLNLLLFLPRHFGWGLFIFSQSLIASLTMFLFLGLLTKNPFAKLTGSIIFAFGGLMTTWLELGTAVHAMAWLPLALYAVKKFAIQAKFRFIFVLIISLSLIILAGSAQVTTYSFLIVALYSLVSRVYLPVLAIAISLGITAIQLFPSIELLQNSIRQSENYTAEVNYGLLSVKDIFKFFIADFFGNPVTRNYWGNLNYSETSGFLGILTLPILIYGFVKLRTKDAVFFFVIFFFSILFAFDNPISNYLYSRNIPLLTSSYASRMLFVTLLAASILAALTINHIKENKNAGFFLKQTFYSWAFILTILLSTSVTVTRRNTLIPFSLLAFFFLSFVVLNFSSVKIIVKNKYHILFSLIVFLVAFDLGRYFLKFNPFVDQALIFPKVPALEYIQKQPGFFRIGREHGETLPPNTWIAYSLSSIEGYDPLYPAKFGEYLNLINRGSLEGSASRYGELTNYASSYIDAANVKYFIALGRDVNGHIPGDFIDEKFEKANYKKVFQDGSAIILENLKAMPRVYFTSANGKRSAEIVSYMPNQVKINTNTERNETLILADQFDEGWQAKIDGQVTPVSRANLIFRAVKVPTGSHEVEFKYYPKSFDIGLKISLLAILLTGSIALVTVKTHHY